MSLKKVNFKSIVPNWVYDATFYQIFPERFFNGNIKNDPPEIQHWNTKPTEHSFYGGDLEGIMQKLPYLEELGVDCIWLNPIFEAPSNHKYDTSNYLKIDSHFGDLNIFRDLVKEVHRRGMRIILDGVFNHTGDKFWAFRDIIKKNYYSSYRYWYFFYDFPVKQVPMPNYECWWGMGHLPKLNVNYPPVRNYLFKVIRFWLEEVRIDGWRLDVPNELPFEFWQKFRCLVKSINSEAFIFGEIWGDGTHWLQGDQFDSISNYQFREHMIGFFAHKKIKTEQFQKRIEEMWMRYRADVRLTLLNLLGSHDTARVATEFREEAKDLDEGNIICSSEMGALKAAVIFQFTYPGVPLIYYGDEIGMLGASGPECRRPMIWEPELHNQELLDLYKTLIRIRKENPVFRYGELGFLSSFNFPSKIYAFFRVYQSDKVLVILNNNARLRKLCIPASSLGNTKGTVWEELLSGEHYKLTNNQLIIKVKKNTGIILKKK